MFKSLTRLSAVILLFAAFFLSAQEEPMILLQKGKPIPLKDVLSKDQFGVLVPAGVNPENGDVMRRFIPFVAMNPASLSLFPFCDYKAVERIYEAVQDREKLIRKKFKHKYPEYEGVQDYTKNLSIYAGVHVYRVLFSALDVYPTGMIGYLYSDSPDSLFYGKIFLYGLIGKKGDVWIGDIYPKDTTIQLNGSTYTVFTVIPPPVKRKFGDDDPDQQAKKRRPRGGQPGQRPGGAGRGGQRGGTPPARR